jgi:P27 family predicted phage terminase small subunit
MGTRGPIAGSQRTRGVGQTRKLGNPGRRALKAVGTVEAPVEFVHHDSPPVPADLGAPGAAIWRKVWSAARWLDAELDDQAVLRFARLVLERQTYADALAELGPLMEIPVVTPTGAVVGRKFESNPAEAMLRRVDKALDALTDRLGLVPLSRGRLGLTAVTATDKAERILTGRRKVVGEQ